MGTVHTSAIKEPPADIGFAVSASTTGIHIHLVPMLADVLARLLFHYQALVRQAGADLVPVDGFDDSIWAKAAIDILAARARLIPPEVARELTVHARRVHSTAKADGDVSAALYAAQVASDGIRR